MPASVTGQVSAFVATSALEPVPVAQADAATQLASASPPVLSDVGPGITINGPVYQANAEIQNGVLAAFGLNPSLFPGGNSNKEVLSSDASTTGVTSRVSAAASSSGEPEPTSITGVTGQGAPALSESSSASQAAKDFTGEGQRVSTTFTVSEPLQSLTSAQAPASLLNPASSSDGLNTDRSAQTGDGDRVSSAFSQALPKDLAETSSTSPFSFNTSKEKVEPAKDALATGTASKQDQNLAELTPLKPESKNDSPFAAESLATIKAYTNLQISSQQQGLQHHVGLSAPTLTETAHRDANGMMAQLQSCLSSLETQLDRDIAIQVAGNVLNSLDSFSIEDQALLAGFANTVLGKAQSHA